MTAYILGYPLRFLHLTDEKGRPLYRRTMAAVVILAALLSVPFIIFEQANFFGEDGLLDRVASFSSTLTGFYIAGLVAVAAFGREISGLDKIIDVGPILLPSRKKGTEPERLTRREYVCLMFGYLAFMSLTLTMTAILALTVASAVAAIPPILIKLGDWRLSIDVNWIRSPVIIGFGLVISSLGVTTLHSLYYLVDRLYAKSPEILKKTPDAR